MTITELATQLREVAKVLDVHQEVAILLDKLHWHHYSQSKPGAIGVTQRYHADLAVQIAKTLRKLR